MVQLLSKLLPDLHVEASRRGVKIRTPAGSEAVVSSSCIGSLPSLRVRRSLQGKGQSFVDFRSGVIHVSVPGVYIHANFVPPRTHLTANECGLLALLCELSTERIAPLILGPAEKTRRRVESISGDRVAKMALVRLRSVLAANDVVQSEGKASTFDKSAAYDLIRSSFTLGSIGVARDFAVRDSSVIRELVQSLGPACIEGAFRMVHAGGGHVAKRDLICSREAAVSIRSRLGPPVGPDYSGPVVLVRTAGRVSVPLLSGKAGRDHLNPILAAAALSNEDGLIGEVGRELWAKVST